MTGVQTCALPILGALMHHITNADVKHFQPMNVNYGLFPELPGRIKKKEKRGLLAERALAALDAWMKDIIHHRVTENAEKN